ncbi:MAG: hypothetical protein ACYC6L_12810 [Anaerolineae bacterium]
MPPFAPFPLTPSELIYLSGELYAKKAFINNIKLLHSDLSVSTSELVNTMLAAAFLASEAEGILRLVPGKRKTLIGGRDVLLAEPAASRTIWPIPSLETQLFTNSQMLVGRAQNFVSGIVYQLLEADCVSPGAEIIDLCKPYLAERGLVEQGEKKILGFLKTDTYSLPAATLQGSRQFPMDRINLLLNTTQQARPDVWKLLLSGIKSGIAQRVEQTSSND